MPWHVGGLRTHRARPAVALKVTVWFGSAVHWAYSVMSAVKE